MSQQSRARARLRRGIRPRRDDAWLAPEAPPAAAVVTWVEDGVATPLGADVGPGELTERAQADPAGYGVIVYPQPTPEAIDALARAWDLHPVLAEDLHHARQRPKLERYGDVAFLVARSAWYVDASESVEFAEFHILVRPDAVAILCQDWRWIDGTPAATFGLGHDREAPHPVLGGPELARLGPQGVVYRLLDAIVDGYEPVLDGLALDQEQIEREVFRGVPTVTERIYRLSREVIDLKHACGPLTGVMSALTAGRGKYATAEELQAYLADVTDHVTRVDAEVTELRASLAQMLDVNATLVAQRQNDDMKKISGWAAILFAPTLVAAIYGMNFDHMPELHWALGYPLALVLMIGFGATLYAVFRRRGWL